MRSMIVFVLAVSAAFAFPADNTEAPKAGGCPGGYIEGQEFTRDTVLYICQSGQIRAKACLAPGNREIPPGGKFDDLHYRLTCQQAGQDLTLSAPVCVDSKGQEHKAGDSYEDGSAYYTCKTTDNKDEPLKPEQTGCSDGGKEIKENDYVPKDNILYQCKKNENGKFKLAKAGCVKDGKQLKAGDTIDDGKFFYNCSVHGRDTVALKPAGCIANGKRINDGDRFEDKEVIYECAIDADKQYVRAVACAQKDASGSTIERKLGCYFQDGAEPFLYEYRCLVDEANNSATKVQVRCNYKVGSGIANVEPGTYRVIEKGTIAGCIKEAAGTLKLQLFQGDNAEQSAKGAGLSSA